MKDTKINNYENFVYLMILANIDTEKINKLDNKTLNSIFTIILKEWKKSRRYLFVIKIFYFSCFSFLSIPCFLYIPNKTLKKIIIIIMIILIFIIILSGLFAWVTDASDTLGYYNKNEIKKEQFFIQQNLEEANNYLKYYHENQEKGLIFVSKIYYDEKNKNK